MIPESLMTKEKLDAIFAELIAAINTEDLEATAAKYASFNHKLKTFLFAAQQLAKDENVSDIDFGKFLILAGLGRLAATRIKEQWANQN